MPERPRRMDIDHVDDAAGTLLQRLPASLGKK